MLTLRYSARILHREWRRFVLPVISLTITATVIFLMFLLTRGGSALVSEKAREYLGGDIVIESYTPVDTDAVLAEVGITPIDSSSMMEFSASVSAGERAVPVSIHVVDDAYPLYGTVALGHGTYAPPAHDAILIDTEAAKRLGVDAGDTVSFAETSYTVAGIVTEEPSALLSGFRFFPRIIMHTSGFLRASVDPTLFRINYHTAYVVPQLSSAARDRLLAYEESNDVDIDIAGTSRTSFDRSLSVVSEFLVVAVLITAVLGAANVYSSTLALMRSLRGSFAILLAIGMRAQTLAAILGVTLVVTVIVGSVLGSIFGVYLFSQIERVLSSSYALTLPTVSPVLFACATFGLVAITTVSAAVPALRRLLHLNPRDMLLGEEDREYASAPLTTFLTVALGTLIPLILLAALLLEDLAEGALAIGAILFTYAGIATIFTLLVRALYRARGKFPFTVRSIIAHKRAEGLFGIVSFTSLFIALTALGTLTLTQVSLTRYLEVDLARTIPTTYVIDVQPSQTDALRAQFPDLTLFLSIGARIIDIDGRPIQELIEAGDPNTDRELGREYNLTPRRELLPSEIVTDGVWGAGRAGEISVDREFAARADISLGSSVMFLIQGFPVSGRVTSLRDTDSRSGLPFFYFVLSPDDIGQFPGTYFGYAYYDDLAQETLGTYLAPRMPNVSVIETDTLAPTVKTIVGTLLTLVFIITIPPLLIATVLIATLVVTSYPARRREGARLQALGATLTQVRRAYLLETVSLTLFAACLAYIASVAGTYVLVTRFLALGTPALFDLELVLGLAAIVTFVGMIGMYLFVKNPMPLRTLLSYDTHH